VKTSHYVGGHPSVPPQISWSQVCVHNELMVALAGELDLAVAAELRERLAAVVRSAPADTIILDLAGVPFLDAHCTGLIVGARATARGRGRDLWVTGLRSQPARLLRLAGLEASLTRPRAGSEGPGDE
jgi:anti-anti-sigma factor